jgi:1-aminocyclopropane-1-carboxylate deaminase
MLNYNLNQLIETITIANKAIDVLRLDKIDENISGNKWFKLKHHLTAAINENAACMCTYGGVWSNHIAAFAAACAKLKLKNTIFVRSDEHLLTKTLQTAQQLGSTIQFLTRAEYKTVKLKNGLIEENNSYNYYIPEGGNTQQGIQGATEIAQIDNWKAYDLIFCAVGTGTTLKGLLKAALPHQQIIGINALKGNFEYNDSLFMKYTNWQIITDYHFSGFAKYNSELIEFMNRFYLETSIPTDIVYTAKMFYGITDLLLSQNYIDKKILVIHSGGLQGNNSLTNNTLIF